MDDRAPIRQLRRAVDRDGPGQARVLERAFACHLARATPRGAYGTHRSAGSDWRCRSISMTTGRTSPRCRPRRRSSVWTRNARCCVASSTLRRHALNGEPKMRALRGSSGASASRSSYSPNTATRCMRFAPRLRPIARSRRFMAARRRRSGGSRWTTSPAAPADVMIATDAGSEGLNLQSNCRLVVNLELPWNPIRLEQRIGRVDRIGQRRTVHAITCSPMARLSAPCWRACCGRTRPVSASAKSTSRRA